MSFIYVHLSEDFIMITKTAAHYTEYSVVWGKNAVLANFTKLVKLLYSLQKQDLKYQSDFGPQS